MAGHRRVVAPMPSTATTSTPPGWTLENLPWTPMNRRWSTSWGRGTPLYSCARELSVQQTAVSRSLTVEGPELRWVRTGLTTPGGKDSVESAWDGVQRAQVRLWSWWSVVVWVGRSLTVMSVQWVRHAGCRAVMSTLSWVAMTTARGTCCRFLRLDGTAWWAPTRSCTAVVVCQWFIPPSHPPSLVNRPLSTSLHRGTVDHPIITRSQTARVSDSGGDASACCTADRTVHFNWWTWVACMRDIIATEDWQTSVALCRPIIVRVGATINFLTLEAQS